jgi:2-iminobutanoate/2-iminopropanoate deaminase
MKKAMVFFLFLFLLLTTGFAEKKVISTPNAPAAIGPYSQAIRVGNTLYLSGQLGLDPKTGKFTPGGFEAQARQALKNQQAVLQAAGFSLDDVVQCQIFVKDLSNYSKFNAIYKEFFKKDFPARAVLEVSRIPADGLIEITMVAVKSDGGGRRPQPLMSANDIRYKKNLRKKTRFPHIVQG